MRKVVFPLLNQYQFYSRKGVRLQILNQLVNIFYQHKNPLLRNQLMGPLIIELQKKFNPPVNLFQWRKRK